MSAAAITNRTWFDTYASTFPKGKVLSHLLGIIIASQFVISGAAHHSIPYPKLPLNTAWLDLPLRLILVWLLLDRNWRVGRMKFSAWDALALGFPIVVGLLYPLSLNDAAIGASTEGYKAFLGDMIRFYTVFILVREAQLWAGFNSRIMLTWVMGGLAFSACIAILQAMNVGGIRKWSQDFYDQIRLSNLNDAYRARGTAQHWNGFANTMVIGLLFAGSALHWRKLKWWEYGFGILFIVGLGLSTSRGGYVTLIVTAFAAACFFLATRRTKVGWTMLGVLAFSLIAFVGIVVSAKVERFNDLIVPPKVQSQDIGSLKYRMEQGQRLTRVGMQYPITGTGPSESLYFNPKLSFWSTASVPGWLDVTYPLLFAQFGIIGLLYMVLLIAFFVRYIRRGNSYHPYAFLAFATGIALATHSFSEMLLRSEVMYLVSIVAALAVTRFPPVKLPTERERLMAKAKVCRASAS